MDTNNKFNISQKNNENTSTNAMGEIQLQLTCNACSKHIIKIVSDNEGVTDVRWDSTSEKLKLSYDLQKTNLDKIEQSIADAGHSTLNYPAKKGFYKEMPDCCKHDQFNE